MLRMMSLALNRKCLPCFLRPENIREEEVGRTAELEDRVKVWEMLSSGLDTTIANMILCHLWFLLWAYIRLNLGEAHWASTTAEALVTIRFWPRDSHFLQLCNKHWVYYHSANLVSTNENCVNKQHSKICYISKEYLIYFFSINIYWKRGQVEWAMPLATASLKTGSTWFLWCSLATDVMCVPTFSWLNLNTSLSLETLNHPHDTCLKGVELCAFWMMPCMDLVCLLRCQCTGCVWACLPSSAPCDPCWGQQTWT